MESFSYHRTVAPLLWAFTILAVGEMMVVHLFLTLRWPLIGWPLFGLSAVSLVWLLLWIRSFRDHPHSICGDELQLRTGFLPGLSVPLSAIGRISADWASGEHRSAGASNLVPLAYPNRMLWLIHPIRTRKGLCERIALRVDDPARFDSAMASRGIKVG